MSRESKSAIEILRPGCNTSVRANFECEQHGGNCCENGNCCYHAVPKD